MRILIALVATLMLSAGAVHAGDVRPPPNADPNSGGVSGGSIDLPGTANIETPPMNTTMKEKRKLKNQKKAVSKDKVQELRQLYKDMQADKGDG